MSENKDSENTLAIQQALIQLGQKDWEMRKAHQEPNKKGQITNEDFEKIDKYNRERLKEIVEEIGWPTISKVGQNASYAAWWVVQHADPNPDFQEECLRLMKEAKKDVLPQNIAYLSDRVAVNKGDPQLYGTQFHLDEHGKNVPRQIQDEENLDERRQLMGLEPFQLYSQKMNGEYIYPEGYQNPMIGSLPKAV